MTTSARDPAHQAPDDPPLPGTSSAPWHARDVAHVARELRTDLARGLAAHEAERRLALHGPNRLEAAPTRSPWSVFVDQFRSLIVGLLLAAAVVAFVAGEEMEAVAILVVVVINALMGFGTEMSAARALAALARQSAPAARVIRDGREESVRAAVVVPGDVVVLEAGVRVPADGRIVEAATLRIEEAALTGESLPVSKSAERLEDEDAVLAERDCMAYTGTVVATGRGRIIVTATGRDTEVGRIGTLVESVEDRASPLEAKLSALGRSLVVAVLGLCTIVVAVGLLRGHSLLPMLEVGISLAVAAVPEGLPAVATMTLAIGMLRMAARGALVRRLPAVETLGSTTVICTDKTGTLTRGEMTVTRYVLGAREIEVSAHDDRPRGGFRESGGTIDAADDDELLVALRVGVLCSDATIAPPRASRDEDRETAQRVLGDPTEGALIDAAALAGLDVERIRRENPRIAERPFDSVTRRMVTVTRNADGHLESWVKGSPATILDRCARKTIGGRETPLDKHARTAAIAANDRLAHDGLRVLALARRSLESLDQDPEQDLVFLGLVGMEDPIRAEARHALDRCRQAGIRVVMLTGDQIGTATAIAGRLGLHRDADEGRRGILHARELRDGADIEKLIGEATGFARVSPADKLRIVESLQAQGEVVAMTGDGVNDAPALERADIGVAMGRKGTELAKEASDMIITDDDFATIVGAVEQGRVIYANILKFVHFLFSCNLAEILTVFAAIVLGWSPPLGPLQILWLNIVTDVFPAMALALEPSAAGAMNRPPRAPDEPLLSRRFIALLTWQGALIAAATLTAFAWALARYGDEPDAVRHATTVAFTTLGASQIAHAFDARSRRDSAFVRPFANLWLWGATAFCIALQVAAVTIPLLREVLHTTPLEALDVAVTAACAGSVVAIVEVAKLLDRHRARTRGAPTAVLTDEHDHTEKN